MTYCIHHWLAHSGIQKSVLLQPYILQYLYTSRFTSLPIPAGQNVTVSNPSPTALWWLWSERSAHAVILRASAESSLNAMVSSPAGSQEMRWAKGKGKGLAYSLSWRVMASQNAGRKLLMVYTSIFNALFLALSVFCWGQVWIEAPYFTATRVIIIVSGTVAQWECVWGQLWWFTAARCVYMPVCVCNCPPNSYWK